MLENEIVYFSGTPFQTAVVAYNRWLRVSKFWHIPSYGGSLLRAYQLLETGLAGQSGVDWTEYNLEGPILSQINQPPFAWCPNVGWLRSAGGALLYDHHRKLGNCPELVHRGRWEQQNQTPLDSLVLESWLNSWWDFSYKIFLWWDLPCLRCYEVSHEISSRTQSDITWEERQYEMRSGKISLEMISAEQLCH